MAADYRDAFYQAYATTHTAPRKGEVTVERVRRLARVWRAHFQLLLPADRAARILDAGCGDGALLWWLQQQGYHSAAGVEVSEEQLAIARRLGVQNLTHASLADYLAGQADAWDVVLLRNVLEHFPKGEALELLKRIRAALRPGGQVILQVPNGQSPFAGRIRYGDFTHELAFTERSLHQVLGVMGFVAVSCRPATPVFLGVTGPLRAVAWRAVQFLYRTLLAAEVAEWGGIVTLDLLVSARKPE
jgi:2-polyprenyl-3-methyl-5-hydroxy-6-metoxy-1,4-benzoquinol methylase